MSFETPIWLYIAPALSLVATLLIGYGLRQRTQLLREFAAERLLPRLTQKAALQRTLVKMTLIALGISLVAIALARPQYGVQWSEQKARGLDIVFALDSSKSMLATDIRPTRLDRAKLAIRDLMERLESDRVGLVVFAGQAFLQTPPTLDYFAFRESLDSTSPSALSRGGSDIGRALEESTKAFPTESNVKVVVLLTDGEDLGGQAIEAAQEAAENGIQVFTIGIGTPEGTYLRITGADGRDEFIRDTSGQPVRSQLDEATLQEIAAVSGGIYSRLSGGGLDQLYDSVLATLPREERKSELKEVKIERFQWFLGFALLLFVSEILIRRRSPQISAVLILTALLSVSPDAVAAEDLVPKSYDVRGFESLQEGKFAEAIQYYQSDIRERDDLSAQRDALYNMGHAKHQFARETYAEGNLEEALEQVIAAEDFFQSAYDIGIDKSPIFQDLEAIKAVREAIESVIEQQQSQEQENQTSEENEGSESSDNQEGQDQKQDDSSGAQESEGDTDQSESDSGEEGQENSESSEGEEQASEETQDEQSQESYESEQQNSDSQEASGDEPGEGEKDSPSSEQESQEEEEQGEQSSAEQVPEVPDGEAQEGGEGQSETESQAVQVQGMTIEQAQDLLDSLREREEILPFNRTTPGQGRPLQDW